MPLGCHLSVAKGLTAAVERANAMGADAFQYFTRNPRSLRVTGTPDLEDAARARARQAELGIVSVGHTPYLVNLAAPDDDLWEASIRSLRDDLPLAAARGTPGIVVHCGKPKDGGVERGIDRMRAALDRVLEVDAPVRILLENTARQGSEIGYDLEQLLRLVDGYPPERVGFCLDTCHAFAAAWMDPDDPVRAFDVPEYRGRLGAVHLNDSMFPYGARRDRHARLGQGTMGVERICRFLAWPALRALAVVLETPVDDELDYEPEIRWARARMAGEAWDPAEPVVFEPAQGPTR
jgi:deoxyribonuclease-4